MWRGLAVRHLRRLAVQALSALKDLNAVCRAGGPLVALAGLDKLGLHGDLKHTAHPHRVWKLASCTHEGFPLLLRFPSYIDFEHPASRFPIVVTVTHVLAHVQESGLPQRDYHLTLKDFDEHMTGLFEHRGLGTIVLVETFGGKRMYYSYVSAALDLAAEESALRLRFPEHGVTWNHQDDPDWAFIRQYARDYRFKDR